MNTVTQYKAAENLELEIVTVPRGNPCKFKLRVNDLIDAGGGESDTRRLKERVVYSHNR